MSRHPFGPSELDQPETARESAVSELESYVATTATDVPHGLGDRVMGAIEQQPTPRRGVLAWLLPSPTMGDGFGRFARVGVFAATLVLAVAGAVLAGQLADLVRNVGTSSPTPTESVSPTPSISQSESPTPSASVAPNLSPSPAASEDGGGSSKVSVGPQASEDETAEPSAEKTAEETSTP